MIVICPRNRKGCNCYFIVNLRDIEGGGFFNGCNLMSIERCSEGPLLYVSKEGFGYSTSDSV